jgi:hypothetical protein
MGFNSAFKGLTWHQLAAYRQCRVSAALLSRKENRGSLITEDEMGGGGGEGNCMGKREMHTGFSREKLKRRYYLEDLGIDGKIY